MVVTRILTILRMLRAAHRKGQLKRLRQLRHVVRMAWIWSDPGMVFLVQCVNAKPVGRRGLNTLN